MGRRHPSNPSMQMVEELIGCKWSLRVLESLRQGHARPGALKRSISGISTKVLNQRLHKLIRYELITKKRRSLKPLHVEYLFTKRGRRLFVVLDAIKRL